METGARFAGIVRMVMAALFCGVGSLTCGLPPNETVVVDDVAGPPVPGEPTQPTNPTDPAAPQDPTDPPTPCSVAVNPPAAPTGFAATSPSSSSLLLTWAHDGVNVCGFRVACKSTHGVDP